MGGIIVIVIGGIGIGVVCAEPVLMLVSAGGDEIEKDPGRAKSMGGIGDTGGRLLSFRDILERGVEVRVVGSWEWEDVKR
jgi:hypothetical protein